MSHDVYIKLTGVDGKSIVNHHRVWDIDRFMRSQVEQYSGPKVKPKDVHCVSLVTETEYKQFIKGERN